MNKLVSSFVVAVTLYGCGGSSDSSGDDQVQQEQDTEVQTSGDCVIVNDTITLSSGEQCDISAASAATYSISEGTVACTDGTTVYNSVSFSGNSSFNGLSFVCGNS